MLLASFILIVQAFQPSSPAPAPNPTMPSIKSSLVFTAYAVALGQSHPEQNILVSQQFADEFY